MSIKYVIAALEKENISLQLEGDNLRVAFEQPLTPEDIDFIKLHKTQLMAYLREQVPLVDLFGRRQCATCNQWAHDRCNHS